MPEIIKESSLVDRKMLLSAAFFRDRLKDKTFRCDRCGTIFRFVESDIRDIRSDDMGRYWSTEICSSCPSCGRYSVKRQKYQFYSNGTLKHGLWHRLTRFLLS